MLLLVLAALTALFGVVHIPNAPELLRNLNGRLLDYLSPLITAVSVLMLLLVSRLRVGGQMGRLIAFLSPLTFGVYVIHVHHVIWMPLRGLLSPLLKLPAILLPFAVILTGAYIICGLRCAELTPRPVVPPAPRETGGRLFGKGAAVLAHLNCRSDKWI